MHELRLFSITLLALFLLTGDGAAQTAPEVHAVGLHSGEAPRSAGYRLAVKRLLRRCARERMCGWGEGWEEIRKRYPSEVTVKVSRVGVPVILVLSGTNPIEWKIDREPGVVLDRIIISGYAQQVLKETPSIAGVPVDSSWQDSPWTTRDSFFAFYEDDREAPVSIADIEEDARMCREGANEVSISHHESNFQRAIDLLARLGLRLTSAQGGYEGSEVTIGMETQGISLPKIWIPSLCYRNPDGTLSPGDQQSD
ncbi:MAG: hypothetical protein RL518_1839 [Pseudomonadota bacterium]